MVSGELHDEADDGREVLRLVKKHKPDVIINFYDLMEAALNPKTTDPRWTQKQTNELIKAFSQINPFSTVNLFEKVSTILRYVYANFDYCN